ncbi:hypothetical protein HDK77DRAFT_261120 [Phyllosticta capitalensis]
MSSANRIRDLAYNLPDHHQLADSPRPSDPDADFDNWHRYDHIYDDLTTLPSFDRLTRDDTGEFAFDSQNYDPASPPYTRYLEPDDNNGSSPLAPYPDDDEWSNLEAEYIRRFDRDQEDDYPATHYEYMSPRRQSPSYVDLTREATPPLSQERSTLSRFSDSGDLSEPNMPPTAKRSRPTGTSSSSSRTTPETSSGPAYKRPRLNNTSRQDHRGSTSRSAFTTGTFNTNNHNSPDISEIEHIDLADDNTTLAEALQKQRVEQVKAQQAVEPAADAPLRLSNLTCVICMDTPKDITATACGHVFCHTCLMEALIAGENRVGYEGPKRSQCPVCRKNLNRNKATDVIPLLLKKGLATQPRRKRQS